jgi:hypothetical protein
MMMETETILVSTRAGRHEIAEESASLPTDPFASGDVRRVTEDATTNQTTSVALVGATTVGTRNA